LGVLRLSWGSHDRYRASFSEGEAYDDDGVILDDICTQGYPASALLLEVKTYSC
jgi:hypothetical protein